MALKYEMATNLDGMFLGNHRTKQDGFWLYSRPYQLQSTIDKWLPNGPEGKTEPNESMQASYIKDLEKESPLCDKTAFKSLMGTLMQLYYDRPGIQYAASKIAQRQEAPRVYGVKALLQIVLFLWYTHVMCLHLLCGDKGIAKTFVTLRGYSDCAMLTI